VLTEEGVDIRSTHWLDAYEMERRGIYLYHYSLVLPKQVLEKSEYYRNADWAKSAKAQEWAQEVFVKLERPYQIHNVYDYPGWLERFPKEHPPEIIAMKHDLESGQLGIDLRPTDDIEALLDSRSYHIGRWILKALTPVGLYLVPALWRDRYLRFRQDPWEYVFGWRKRRAHALSK
jgi:hypothetical protein